MSLHRPTVLLAAALVVGATVAPAAAFADGTTPPAPTTLTADQLRQELTADQASTATKAQAGWLLAGTDTANGTTYTFGTKYTGSAGSVTSNGVVRTIEVEHTGTYLSLGALVAEAPGLGVRGALTAIARPSARWVMEPQKSLDLMTGNGPTASLAPGNLLKALADPTTQLTNPTKTLAGDGSGIATYVFSAKNPSDNSYDGAYTLTIGADGVLTEADTVAAPDHVAMTFTYAPQQITAPAAGTFVTDKQFSEGISLSHMVSDATKLAQHTATTATKQAHKHVVTARAIRSIAGPAARQLNRIYGVKTFTTRTVARGVRITAVNPFTHARATWTVSAAGKQAVARRG